MRSPRHHRASGGLASIASRTASSACRFAWMSEMTATRNGLSSRWTTISLVLMALAWLVAAPLLWRSQVPGDLDLPNLDPRDYFSAVRARSRRALRAVPAHRHRPLARRHGHRAPRPRPARSTPGPEHGAGADRRRDDRRDGHARRRLGGEPPVRGRRCAGGTSGTASRTGPGSTGSSSPGRSSAARSSS